MSIAVAMMREQHIAASRCLGSGVSVRYRVDSALGTHSGSLFLVFYKHTTKGALGGIPSEAEVRVSGGFGSTDAGFGSTDAVFLFGSTDAPASLSSSPLLGLLRFFARVLSCTGLQMRPRRRQRLHESLL